MLDLSHDAAARALGLNDETLLQRRSFLAGEWIDAEDSFEVRDPGAMAPLAACAAMDAAAARRALEAARAAFPAWAALPPEGRAVPLRRWAALMREAREDLARLMTAEQGKPISEARGEIDYAADFLGFYAEEALRPNIEGVTSHLPDAEMELWREPLGVVALITPWNFPSAMLTRKAGAALAAGCAVLAHPSHETPFSALALAVLAERAGIPAGVFNVLAGDAATVTGPWLEDARVRGLSFTGSTEVGKMLAGKAAATMKRCVMELGGHAPSLIFADCDFPRAVAETVKAKYATSGQDCLAANRILVERSLYPAFVDAFAAASAALTTGAGMADPAIGPLMNEAAAEKQEAQVEDALARGARLVCGTGKRIPGTLIVAPTVLADVPPGARILREETFGPVAALLPFDSESEALAEANSTEYGLIAYVHTNDPRRIFRLSRRLEFGMVAVNRTKVTGAPIPFGGVKQSGLGREGARQGLEAFTEIKYVCRDWS